jgi:peroxiredoxin
MFQARGLAMVGVSLRERADVVREWGEDFDIGFPLWLDPDGASLGPFGVPGHPSTILIDRAGRIVGRVPGERDWRTPEARRLVEWLLEQGAP